MTAPQGAQNQMNAAQESAGEGMRPGAEKREAEGRRNAESARRMTATKRRAEVPWPAQRGREKRGPDGRAKRRAESARRVTATKSRGRRSEAAKSATLATCGFVIRPCRAFGAAQRVVRASLRDQRSAEKRPAKRSRAPHQRQTRRCAIANPSLPSPAGDGPARRARVTSAKRFAVCCQRSAPQQFPPHKAHSDVCWPIPAGMGRKIPHPRKKENFPSL